MTELKLGMTVKVGISTTGLISLIFTVEKTNQKTWADGFRWPVYGEINEDITVLDLDKMDYAKYHYFVRLDNDVNKTFEVDNPTKVRPVLPKITKDDLSAIGLYVCINQMAPTVFGTHPENCANFQEQKDWVINSLKEFDLDDSMMPKIIESCNGASQLMRVITDWQARIN